MLKQFDTLIGFALIMSIGSLLVTVLTQMISAFFGLRGKNLRDGLQTLIYTIDQEFKPAVAQELLDRVLTHPIISDSTLSIRKSRYNSIPLLGRLAPRWKLATGIRPDEFLGILEDVAGMTAEHAAATRGTMGILASFVSGGVKMTDTRDNTVDTLNNWVGEAEAVAERAQEDAQKTAKIVEEAPDAEQRKSAQRELARRVIFADAKRRRVIAINDLLRRANKARKDTAMWEEFGKHLKIVAAAARLLAELYTPASGRVRISPVAFGHPKYGDYGDYAVAFDE